jgi:hypothetical protein
MKNEIFWIFMFFSNLLFLCCFLFFEFLCFFRIFYFYVVFCFFNFYVFFLLIFHETSNAIIDLYFVGWLSKSISCWPWRHKKSLDWYFDTPPINFTCITSYLTMKMMGGVSKYRSRLFLCLQGQQDIDLDNHPTKYKSIIALLVSWKIKRKKT